MIDILMDALIDSVKMIPFLFAIYILIEFIELRLGNNLIKKVKTAGRIAPVLGAAFGLVPQCGFSVMATALYTKRVITIGTLLAVYISTSDEALPVILSHPDKLGYIFPLLATKFIIALLSGYIIDLLMSRSHKSSINGELCATVDESLDLHPKNGSTGEEICCEHEGAPEKHNIKHIMFHTLVHTLKVFAFIFVASLLINFIILQIGEENLGTAFLGNTLFQPILASIFGLIPNCASSIALTEIFLKGGLSFGSTIAGLSSGAGLGLLVLFRENNTLKDSFKILGLLVLVSSLSGILIQFFIG